MNESCKGYLFSKEMRTLPALTVVSLVILYASVLVLWFNQISQYLSQGKLEVAVWAFAGLWTLFVLFFTYRAVKSNHFIGMQYQCRGCIATVFANKHIRAALDIGKPFYVAKIAVRFYYGKSAENIWLYVLLPDLDKMPQREFVGSQPVEDILDGGGVVLPAAALPWIESKLGVPEISEYPKTMYFSGVCKE